MTNQQIVEALYAAFDQGDIAGAAALMADDIVWNEAENNKLADRNPYIGPAAVVEGVFGRLGEDFDGFAVEIGTLIAAGDHVAMQGHYRATAKATGTVINPEIVHWWTAKGGKITAYQQHVDTLMLARVIGEVA
ncbi:MAG: nuclear transport factor 2 family protein [Erythrobacter sp.]